MSHRLDTKGPEIRMGGLKVCKESGNRKAKITMTKGETITLSNDPALDGASCAAITPSSNALTAARRCHATKSTERVLTHSATRVRRRADRRDEKMLYVGYDRLAEKVVPGTKVLLDDGLISLIAKEARQCLCLSATLCPAVLTLGRCARQTTDDGAVVCEIINTAEIGERKGVNLPGVITELPPLSEKDKSDIAFGIENDIDCVAGACRARLGTATQRRGTPSREMLPCGARLQHRSCARPRESRTFVPTSVRRTIAHPTLSTSMCQLVPPAPRRAVLCLVICV